MKKTIKYGFAAMALLFAASGIDEVNSSLGLGFSTFVSPANAVVVVRRGVGAPGSVARRTTRRVIRRGAFIARIPAGCPYGSYYGYSLYYCGGTYYQKSGSGYAIVYF